MVDDMLALANSVSLLVLSRSDRRVLALLLARVEWCAVLCCAVFAEQRKQRISERFPNK